MIGTGGPRGGDPSACCLAMPRLRGDAMQSYDVIFAGAPLLAGGDASTDRHIELARPWHVDPAPPGHRPATIGAFSFDRARWAPTPAFVICFVAELGCCRLARSPSPGESLRRPWPTHNAASLQVRNTASQ